MNPSEGLLRVFFVFSVSFPLEETSSASLKTSSGRAGYGSPSPVRSGRFSFASRRRSSARCSARCSRACAAASRRGTCGREHPYRANSQKTSASGHTRSSCVLRASAGMRSAPHLRHAKRADAHSASCCARRRSARGAPQWRHLARWKRHTARCALSLHRASRTPHVSARSRRSSARSTRSRRDAELSVLEEDKELIDERIVETPELARRLPSAPDPPAPYRPSAAFFPLTERRLFLFRFPAPFDAFGASGANRASPPNVYSRPSAPTAPSRNLRERASAPSLSSSTKPHGTISQAHALRRCASTSRRRPRHAHRGRFGQAKGLYSHRRKCASACLRRTARVHPRSRREQGTSWKAHDAACASKSPARTRARHASPGLASPGKPHTRTAREQSRSVCSRSHRRPESGQPWPAGSMRHRISFELDTRPSVSASPRTRSSARDSRSHQTA